MCVGPWKELTKHVDETLWSLDRAPECFSNLLADPMLECQLPKMLPSTGEVVKHAFETVERTCRRHQPMVFKFGWTSDPHIRFRNPKYGYSVDRYQKWQCMVVVFASSEAIGPAFLEAALIHHYQSNSAYVYQSFLAV